MRIDIITIFPKMFAPVLNESIIKRAQAKNLVKIRLHDLRDYSNSKHRKVDERPFGGGPGMVFGPEPIFRAVEITVQPVSADWGSVLKPVRRIRSARRLLLPAQPTHYHASDRCAG